MTNNAIVDLRRDFDETRKHFYRLADIAAIQASGSEVALHARLNALEFTRLMTSHSLNEIGGLLSAW